jgi:hypothetical protein
VTPNSGPSLTLLLRVAVLWLDYSRLLQELALSLTVPRARARGSCEVIAVRLCGIEERLRQAIPLVERQHQLGGAEFSANLFLDCFQITRELPKPFICCVVTSASISRGQGFKLLF